VTAAEVLALARAHAVMLATAESCTGGLLAGALTDLPGSSDMFERGFVTYSNAAKTDMLGVSPELIATHGLHKQRRSSLGHWAATTSAKKACSMRLGSSATR